MAGYNITKTGLCTFVHGDIDQVLKDYDATPLGLWVHNNGMIEHNNAMPYVSPVLDKGFQHCFHNMSCLNFYDDFNLIERDICIRYDRVIKGLNNNNDIDFVLYIGQCGYDEARKSLNRNTFEGEFKCSDKYIFFGLLNSKGVDWSKLKNENLFPDKKEYFRLMKEVGLL